MSKLEKSDPTLGKKRSHEILPKGGDKHCALQGFPAATARAPPQCMSALRKAESLAYPNPSSALEHKEKFKAVGRNGLKAEDWQGVWVEVGRLARKSLKDFREFLEIYQQKSGGRHAGMGFVSLG